MRSYCFALEPRFRRAEELRKENVSLEKNILLSLYFKMMLEYLLFSRPPAIILMNIIKG